MDAVREKLASELVRLREENVDLRRQLVEALGSAVVWGAYAGTYFQNKLGYAADIEKLKAAREALLTGEK